jgi:hypothetical protein
MRHSERRNGRRQVEQTMQAARRATDSYEAQDYMLAKAARRF